jgi:hypothetical protein
MKINEKDTEQNETLDTIHEKDGVVLFKQKQKKG